MRLLIAVFNELFDFGFYGVKSFFVPVPPHTTFPSLQAPLRNLEIPEMTETSAGRPLSHTLAHELGAEVSKNIQKNTIMYTSSIATPLRSEPGAIGDAVYTTLPYGSMVMVLDARDMWAYVASGPFTGWVYIDDLEDRAAHVYPSFHIGEANEDDDPSTIRVRAIISDEFGAGDVSLPLQAEEYVLYKLMRKGTRVVWPPIRPRSPGTWTQILSSMPGVKVSSTPSAGSVLEFMLPKEDENIRGHLGYVEAVFPDNALQISEIGWPEEGMYNERVLVEAEWKALSPSFLSFS